MAKPQAHVLRRIDAQSADDEALRLDDVGRLLHPGRDVGAHEVHRGAGLGRDELVGLEVDAEALGVERVHEGGAGEVARHGAVARRHLAEIFGADDAAGAFHVLNDDVGLALDVAREMLGEQAALDVGRPAGGEVDQDGEPLALVEGIVGESLRRGEREKAQNAMTARTKGILILPVLSLVLPQAYPPPRNGGEARCKIAAPTITMRTTSPTTSRKRRAGKRPTPKLQRL